ncbi:hypothetical protein DPMN_112511 [Dreissena polymorpha]|uniref:Uncharacterized protein n=1 Tax=Dreissena polymorpha TaxID=45954 RepID=A0A9D4KGM7_DREPO|nr:hypothetical protein DPMN_112511 [Dreissena polymorpha]
MQLSDKAATRCGKHDKRDSDDSFRQFRGMQPSESRIAEYGIPQDSWDLRSQETDLRRTDRRLILGCQHRANLLKAELTAIWRVTRTRPMQTHLELPPLYVTMVIKVAKFIKMAVHINGRNLSITQRDLTGQGLMSVCEYPLSTVKRIGGCRKPVLM